uniref:ATP synthase subunit a n=1 Tax=Pectinatella magnifica TaxID=350071 RepID=A0A344AUW6_9BILA|nr:ATP synthase F0 subunit 6 [Pectinatella magnifica]AWX65963.1 ATP synthase F0 subunit 6 [Pectinatella magnifica]
MLMDIFSALDLGYGVLLNCSLPLWSSAMLVLFSGLTRYWWPLSRMNSILAGLLELPFDLSLRSRGSNLGGFTPFLVTLFYYLVVLNLLGLIPYGPSISSHFTLTMALALPIWTTVVLSGVTLNPYEFMSHFCPLGAPLALAPFLVLVEIVSFSVRPLTLAVRLAANMTAGHIVLALLGICYSYVSVAVSAYPLLVWGVGILYFIFEVGVGIIQGYIFMLLVSMYFDEHPSHT